MKRIAFLSALLGATALAGLAVAQTPTPQVVTSITPGVDLVPIVPNGQPTPQQKYTSVATLRSGSADGITAAPLRLLDFKNADGTTLAASASSGKFGLSVTGGTSETLVTEAANSNTKTDVAVYEYIVPASYVAGQNITVTANTSYTLGSGTVGTHTLASAAYLTAANGTQGSTLIATAAQTVPASAGNVTFTITGATLTPGARLLLTFTLVIQDTGASNITANLNSVTLS